jgi:Flp pilus assembly protein TadB
MKMSQNQRLEISLAKLEERVESIQDDMKELKTDVTQLRATADKWRGGFWVMMALGGVVGVVANLAMGWFK